MWAGSLYGCKKMPQLIKELIFYVTDIYNITLTIYVSYTYTRESHVHIREALYIPIAYIPLV